MLGKIVFAFVSGDSFGVHSRYEDRGCQSLVAGAQFAIKLAGGSVLPSRWSIVARGTSAIPGWEGP